MTYIELRFLRTFVGAIQILDDGNPVLRRLRLRNLDHGVLLLYFGLCLGLVSRLVGWANLGQRAFRPGLYVVTFLWRFEDLES